MQKSKIPSPQAGAVLAVNLHIDSGHSAHHGDGLRTCTHMSLVSSVYILPVLGIQIRIFFLPPISRYHDPLVRGSDPSLFS